MKILRSIGSLDCSHLYSMWLVVVFSVMGHALLSGEYQYRMGQVVDYIGNLPAGVTRSSMTYLLVGATLLAGLTVLLVGAFLLEMDKRQKRWAHWPLVLFCAAMPIWVTKNVIALAELYYRVIDLYDFVLCGATLALLPAIMLISHSRYVTAQGASRHVATK